MGRAAVTEGRDMDARHGGPVDRFLDVDGVARWFTERGRPMTARQVYRLAEAGWPILKVGGKLLARASALQNHIICQEIKATTRRRRA